MDWLKKQDEYEVVNDNDAFIDKSIIAFASLLSRVQKSNINNATGALYKVNPVLKMASTLLVIILVSLSRELWFVTATNLAAVLLLSFIDMNDRRRTLTFSATITLFTAVMLVPSMLAGNIGNSMLIIFKVFCNTNLVYALSMSSRWHQVTKALKILSVPDIFIMIFDLTIRYIYLLGELSLDMMQGLKARTIGKNKGKYSTMAGIMGNLFIKTMDTGSQMFSAMECRGYTGEYRRSMSLRFGKIDLYYGVMVSMVVIIYIVSIL